jgi:hypothetical protein
VISLHPARVMPSHPATRDRCLLRDVEREQI